MSNLKLLSKQQKKVNFNSINITVRERKIEKKKIFHLKNATYFTTTTTTTAKKI